MSVLSDNEDKVLPFAATLLGALVAVACVGPGRRLPAGRAVREPDAGWLLLGFTAPNLPAFDTWILPVVALAGGASVAVSVRRSRD